jgi:tetratricopeptide (TPR) repeat protein
VFDDVIIRDNPSIHVNRFSQIFSIFFDPDSSRRIGLMSFAINFYFSGMNPAGYKITNVIIHLLNGYILFLLIYITLNGTDSGDNHKNKAYLISLAGTLLWIVHPLNTQAVTYVIQRFTSLASLFFMLSLLLYVKGRLSGSRNRYTHYGLAFIAALFAFGSKQTAATLPVMILLYEICFFKSITLELNKKTIQFSSVILIIVIVISLIFLSVNQDEGIMERFTQRGITPVERLLTESRVIILYISLIVYPNPGRLNVDYDFQKSTGLFSPPTTILSILIIIALLILAVLMINRNMFIAFSIFWFFGNLVIESTIIPLDLVYEHRLYTPTMMPLALVAGFLISRNLPWKWPALGLYTIGILLFSFWTYQRNFIWMTPITLWEDNIKKSPNKARVHGNLGKAYLDNNMNEKALTHFEYMLKLDPSQLGAYDNIATIYINHYKDFDRAKQYLLEALRQNPDYPSPYLNLGVINLRLKQLPEAVKNFEKVLELDPTNALGYYNLAAAQFNLRDYAEAIQTLRKGLNIWPLNAQLYSLLGLTYFEKQDFGNSEFNLRKALSIDPENGMARMYMQKLLDQKSK